MVTRGKPIPSKLKHDAIVEALFEIRFNTETLAEVLFARLADRTPFQEFERRRMATHDIPASLLESDPNLRYQSIFELADVPQNRAIRIGPHVLSYHRKAPYVGWEKFKPELHDVITGLFAVTDGLAVTRLGLRYINALRSTLHSIRSVADLDLSLSVAMEPLSGSVNLNFTTAVAENTQCTTRLATIDLVLGPLPSDATVLADIDVSTTDSFRTTEEQPVLEWIELAHSKEKEQFFRLLTDDTIAALREN